MLRKYDFCSELKEEIKNYIDMLGIRGESINESELKGIVKKMLFIKEIAIRKGNHYSKCMVYDMLLVMHSLTQTSLRNFYIVYRSFIENFVRFTLFLPDDDETGVRNLFNCMYESFTGPEDKIYIDYIWGEYGKCCGYVHSNISVNTQIYEYYSDILQSDEMAESKVKQLITHIGTFLNSSTKFLLRNRILIIDSAFYRKKQKLQFLIGENNYLLFMGTMKNIMG